MYLPHLKGLTKRSELHAAFQDVPFNGYSHLTWAPDAARQ